MLERLRFEERRHRASISNILLTVPSGHPPWLAPRPTHHLHTRGFLARRQLGDLCSHEGLGWSPRNAVKFAPGCVCGLPTPPNQSNRHSTARAPGNDEGGHGRLCLAAGRPGHPVAFPTPLQPISFEKRTCCGWRAKIAHMHSGCGALPRDSCPGRSWRERASPPTVAATWTHNSDRKSLKVGKHCKIPANPGVWPIGRSIASSPVARTETGRRRETPHVVPCIPLVTPPAPAGPASRARKVEVGKPGALVAPRSRPVSQLLLSS